ncbi:MAG: FAD-binding protein [Sulfolobales archaeon]|nr:FAD-binding protein [Sulfolobales archaeon]
MSLLRELQEIVGKEWVISGEAATLYSHDAFLLHKGSPSLVVLPGSEEEAIRVVRLLLKRKERFIVRGSGTSLSGASTPLDDEVVVSLARLNRVHSVEGFEVEVGPGIANFSVSKSLPTHLFYAPDPSSYQVSSIGGNLSHDSGGIRVVKYGPTYNSVLGLRVLLPDGSVEEIRTSPLLNHKSIFVGAEGTLGVILRARLRTFRRPETTKTLAALFDSLEKASRAIVEIFNRGVNPSGLELMDRYSIRAVERSRFRAGIPETEALLLIELEGIPEEIRRDERVVLQVLEELEAEVIVPKDKEEESRLWAARRGAFPAMAYIFPAYITLDCNVLRRDLSEALLKIREIARKHGVYIANVFHAGDGNLHPLIPFDPNNRESMERAVAAGVEVEKVVIELGGVPSGEHGIGIEKVGFMRRYYTEDELKVFRRIKEAFDPDYLMNPCKLVRREDCRPASEVLTKLWEAD